MIIEVLPQAFTICKLADETPVDLSAPYCFVAKTDAELSLVCPTSYAPAGTLAREDGWRAFRVAGVLPFSLTGVLSRLTGVLAAKGVPVFAVSTFETDYVLVKQERWQEALAALESDGIRALAAGHG
ncbi:MAG: ACT domain-containing protein [Eubacteriales bacterium]|nr:ACT domain-containing protein [Eubacteriales bacterium]